MKVRKTYTLFVNRLTGAALYGGSKFNQRISKTTLGEIYDCSLSELKHNILALKKQGISTYCRKY